MTDSEEAVLDALRRDLTVYVLQKNSSDNSDFLGLISIIPMLYWWTKKKHVIVEVDAKLYENFQSLKLEYEELKWLLVYPGDWHLLSNYQIALVKPYFEPGLRELMQVSSSSNQKLQSIQTFP